MRTLTSAISASIDTQRMSAVYVVEIKSGATVLVRATNWAEITDWDGTGNHAYAKLIESPEIAQFIDWRGGLADFEQPEFKIGDQDGTIRAALRTSLDLDIEVWFLLVSGTIAKTTQAIQIYAGVVSGFSVKGHNVAVRGGDRRQKRYPRSLLSKVDLDNTDNFCGAGRKMSAHKTWDTSQWYYEDEWLPEDTKGALIPITFNRPQRCKLVFVSRWPGAEELSATYDLRGPLFIMSDLKVDYGTGLVSPIGTVFRLDRDSGELFNVCTAYTNLQKGQVYEITGPAPLVCIAADDDANNPWSIGKAINTYHRSWPRNRDTIHANIDGDWQAFWDRMEDQYQALKWTGANLAGLSNVTILDISFLEEQFPADAHRFRHAYIEAFVKNYGTALPAAVKIQIALRRNPDWSGHSDTWLDFIDLLTSAQSEFNNWDWGTGSENWADGSVQFGGGTPFQEGGALGPEPIDSLRQSSLGLRAINTSASPQNISGGDFRIFGFQLITCLDFALEKIHDVLGAHCDYSFDNYAMSRTGASDYCRAYESIYATMVKLFGISTANILASASWATLAGTGWHDDNRLDFQMLDDMSGRELLDAMAVQSSLWLQTGDDGKEEPIFLDRARGRGTDEVALAPDFDEDTIKAGSLSIELGEEDDLYNRFRVRFYRDVFGGGYLKEFYVDENGGNCPTSLLNSEVSGWCEDSQDRNGTTRELVFDADLVQDETTAEYLLKSMAARLVERPLILRFLTSLAGVRWELGDFPLVAHADWLAVSRKYSNTNPFVLSFEASGSNYKFVISGAVYDATKYQPGDWILADIEGTTFDGWYRLKSVIVTADVGLVVDAPAGASGTYDVSSIAVYPAMMVTAQRIKGNEVEMELTEIPYDPS